mgnify:CR=1 FL=1
MKTIITILVALIVFFISSYVSANDDVYKADTVLYKFDNMLVVVASTQCVLEDEEITQIIKEAAQTQKVLNEMTIAKPANDEVVTISYKEIQKQYVDFNYKNISLSRSARNTKNFVLFDDGNIFEKEFGRYCVMLSFDRKNLKIFVDDLSALKFISSETFKEKMRQASKYFKEKSLGCKQNKMWAFIDLRKEEVKGYVQEIRSEGGNIIYLTGGLGAGWIKNTFVSSVNFDLGFGINKKGLMKNYYWLSYELMYDFSNSTENKFYELDHFLSLGWSHNFTSNPEKENWWGVSLGYLVKRDSDFFKKNTFRLSFNKKINNTFTVKPELYFNDFCKNVYPGIRVAVNF